TRGYAITLSVRGVLLLVGQPRREQPVDLRLQPGALVVPPVDRPRQLHELPSERAVPLAASADEGVEHVEAVDGRRHGGSADGCLPQGSILAWRNRPGERHPAMPRMTAAPRLIAPRSGRGCCCTRAASGSTPGDEGPRPAWRLTEAPGPARRSGPPSP